MDIDTEIDLSEFTGSFIIVRNGKWEKYERYGDIPESFDKIVSYIPKPSNGAATWSGLGQQWIDVIGAMRNDLLNRETNSDSLLLDTIKVPEMPTQEQMEALAHNHGEHQ